VLANIEWEKYRFDQLEDLLKNLGLADREDIDYHHSTVDFAHNKPGQLWDIKWGEKLTEQVTSEISLSLMVSQLMDKVPNAWQAVRILEIVLAALRKNGVSEEKISVNSVFVVEEIKKHCFHWLLKKSEKIFRRKLNDGTIFLRLLAEPFLELNWEMKDTIEVCRNPNEDAVPLEKNMFQPQYRSNYNGLEQKVAFAINNKDVVEWWHRLAVKGTEYSVQGWKRDRIYPDFLVKLEAGKTGIEKLCFIETKGEHLSGNEDTKYKQELFDTINASLKGNVKPKGELKLMEAKEEISFHMVFDDEWENALNKLFAA
jgi:type III restriction enzyme